jgi:TRAP-type mannitol/chloroaromatic compound transport system permease large subunit
MLKLDGFLWTDPPALTAAGTFGHIVLQGPSIVLIVIAQGRGRTIFHAGQTTVASIIYLEI